jgi:hypothetical protein
MTTNPSAKTKQAIAWMEWSEEVFRRARLEKKLILLDSGASWCHWCHVMDRMTYDHPDVISAVMRRYIPVRIDRDRLPDVDAKYQRWPALVHGSTSGGWPLTVILTPLGDPLYKNTFLPPHPAPQFGDAPGLAEVLVKLDEHWNGHREDVLKSGLKLRKKQLSELESLFVEKGKLSKNLLDEVFQGIQDSYDQEYGGFGHEPKFFATPAIEFLMISAWARRDGAADMLIQTLDAISKGGVCDHVGGGFHRYSTDFRWRVPHFEKMAADNAALMAIYAEAGSLTDNRHFANLAERTRDWLDRVLRAPDGAFYASQDADVGLEDDGDYYTWTLEDFYAILGTDAQLVAEYYGVDIHGDMRERPGRNVLHVDKSVSEVSRLMNIPRKYAAQSILNARHRLLDARQQRPTPSVDRTIFADINGQVIDGLFRMAAALSDGVAAKMALEALAACRKNLRDSRGLYGHFRSRNGLRRVGLLSDQAWMMRALLDAFCWTAKQEYLDEAVFLGKFVMQYLTCEKGAFLSRPQPRENSLVMINPERNWEDAPNRAAASVTAETLLELGVLTGNAEFTKAARKALESFAGGVSKKYGVFLAGYALAADQAIHGPRTILILGGGEDARQMTDLARRAFLPGKVVLNLDPVNDQDAQRIAQLGYTPTEQGTVAYVCRGNICFDPAHTVEELAQRLEDLQMAG